MIGRPPRSPLFPSTTLFRSVADPAVRGAIFPMIEEEYQRTVEVILRLSGGREIADRFPQFGQRLARRLPTLAQVNRQQIELRSEEHTSELQSLRHLACRLLL